MYDKRAEARAAKYGILEKIQALEKELLEIEGISNIEFDLDNYPDLHQVILIPRYKVPDAPGNWFKRRANQLARIVEVCENHGLLNSGDRIEDYGEHWYIVRDCDSSWPRLD